MTAQLDVINEFDAIAIVNDFRQYALCNIIAEPATASIEFVNAIDNLVLVNNIIYIMNLPQSMFSQLSTEHTILHDVSLTAAKYIKDLCDAQSIDSIVLPLQEDATNETLSLSKEYYIIIESITDIDRTTELLGKYYTNNIHINETEPIQIGAFNILDANAVANDFANYANCMVKIDIRNKIIDIDDQIDINVLANAIVSCVSAGIFESNVQMPPSDVESVLNSITELPATVGLFTSFEYDHIVSYIDTHNQSNAFDNDHNE